MTDYLTQLNSEGAKGYRALSAQLYVGGSNPVSNTTIYVKDQTQTSTFAYQFATGSSAPTIAQDNSYGMQGYAYWGWMSAISTSYGNLFIKANNCKGFLCTAINPAQYVTPPMTVTSIPTWQ